MDTARAPEEDMNQIIKRIAGLNSQTEAQIAFRELKLKKSEVFEITTQVHSIFKRNWEKQPAYRGGMGRHLVEDVHGFFRSGFRSLVAKGKVDVRAFKSLNKNLHHHHEAEDGWFFPPYKKSHPHLAQEFNILEKDHKTLVALEKKVLEGDYEALVEYVDLLENHLNREEMILMPLLVKM